MIPLRHREPWLSVAEYMDLPDAHGEAVDQALDELRIIHRFLGGRRCTVRGLEALGGATALNGRLDVLDVGCGGGELAPLVASWAAGRCRQALMALVDFNPSACRRARRIDEALAGRVSVVRADAFELPFPPRSFDVVHLGLFLHHFDGDRAAVLLEDLLRVCRVGLIVNDLHRHFVPHLAVSLGTRCLSRSRMVRHDGPLSVRRGFRRRDLEDIARQAGFRWTGLRRVWPYRWLAVKRVGESG